ncbi:MAG TPA: hypothetical protein VHF50_03905 [Solirubrobacterales bacterium]|nr:hypothetical protein [Solirubrobacterales bacterium]
MLDLPRYLVGVADLLLLAGFAWLGGSALRARLLPDFRDAPAHLATSVLALALLLLVAELLGTFGVFESLPYLLGVGLAGLLCRVIASPAGGAVGGTAPEEASATGGGGGSPVATGPAGRSALVPSLVGLAVAGAALVKFGIELKPHLSVGMTGFDSTWYHGPFAAGFFQSGDTWELHYIAPQFLAWLYPANSEAFHGIGMGVFDRDLLSPLLNFGWFAGCLLACWCIGRPYGVAHWSLALGAIALSVPAMADQAGEARNDIVGIFFLLAAAAIVLNAGVRTYARIPQLSANSIAVVGLAAGLAAGTKLNFLLPAAVLVLGLPILVGKGERGRAYAASVGAAFFGGGYWYLRNLVHTGNPLPWIDSIGPVSLPAPDQALGGRDAHSVLGYLTDGAVWSDWFLPGLHDGLWFLWPLLLLAAIGGLLLALIRGADPALRLAGAVGLAAALAWFVAPTSASGPDGMPRGFESGLRYLMPALVLGLALLPATLPVPLRGAGIGGPSNGRILKVPGSSARHLSGRGTPYPRLAAWALLGVLAVALGYPLQRHYLDHRYADPSFTTPGLNAAFAWARDVSDARIATTSTRQYPLFGTDLSNEVEFVGVERPHGGFVAPSTCRSWRRLLNAGDYDYVVASRDRLEPAKPPYPDTARWTEGNGATVILREPPTVVFRISGPLAPSGCGPE